MSLAFAIIACLTIAAAVAAMTLRNLVHSTLAVAMTFIGLAATYLQLNAQFVGFAQVLVYVGAVAILIVFAVLLTRGGESAEKSVFSTSWMWGALVALGVFATLTWALLKSSVLDRPPAEKAEASVRQIGDALMSKYVLPLEVIGLLLTAAMIGAVIIAMKDDDKTPSQNGTAPAAAPAPGPSASGGHS